MNSLNPYEPPRELQQADDITFRLDPVEPQDDKSFMIFMYVNLGLIFLMMVIAFNMAIFAGI